MSARFDEASLVLPLRWFAATCLLFATGALIQAFDDAIAELEQEGDGC